MSMNTAQNRLAQAAKELAIHWETAHASWDDVMSRRFYESHLAGLEPTIRAAVAAMEKMSELLARAKQECGP